MENRVRTRQWRSMLAAISAALLAACSDTPPSVSRIISFGDSMSDVGTYKVGTIAAVGGGRFTTNPGRMWIESVASAYGVAAVTPNVLGGMGVEVTQPGGTGYAQGGARVLARQGTRCVSDGAGGCTIAGALTYPVSMQVSNHLANSPSGFGARELVLVLAGANDIFAQYEAVGVGAITPATAIANIQTAGTDLANIVKNDIVGRGAQRVVVLNLPDIGATPFGASQSADGKNLLSTMVATFNGQLAKELAGSIATQIDLYTRFNAILAAPATYQISNTILPACSAAAISTLTGGSTTDGLSLFCSTPGGPVTAGTLVAPNADTQYLFADGVHPTTLGHQLISDYVMNQIRPLF